MAEKISESEKKKEDWMNSLGSGWFMGRQIGHSQFVQHRHRRWRCYYQLERKPIKIWIVID